jgi:hypothetical protein
MKISHLIVLVFLFSATFVQGQLITIADARLQPDGSTVMVSGVVTSGSEFGTIRYIQDGTGGIAVFSSLLSSTVRGDVVTVTGVTTQFQNLLEITPVNSWALNASGNPLPAPLVLTPSQLSEQSESMLVQINNVTFASTGVFQGNSSYTFNSNGQSGIVYIRSSNPLVGQPIPTSNITLYGIVSQFASQYQLLPRDQNDLVNSSSISITVPPFPINITNNSFNVSWNTDVPGNSFVRYGNTPLLELGVLQGQLNTTNPVVGITGASPSELFYVQAFSVAGSDTAFSNVKPYITASQSTGVIKTYFNRPVDNYVANPLSNTATYLPQLFDDTLKAYIDRAVSTLDIAIYSFDANNTGLIIQAVNDAYNRGVQVRVIADGSNANPGLAQLNPAIPVILSPTTPPTYYGIMHNKFFVIDANHPDANKAVVMSGSTNWSQDQLNNDRNNLVFIQDKSLALVYQMEFEEMWGGSGAQPVPANSKFGPDKQDNTPHELNIGGVYVESYFSPSDNTNNQILRTINTADHELYFATLVFTRFDLAYGVEERVNLYGVYAAGIMDDSTNGSGTSFLIMQGVMGNRMLLFDHASQPGILHHKYLIVDQAYNGSDPLVLTGSHNWSSTANLRNDENTLVIHHQLIANQYYQEFHNLFNSNGGAVGVAENSHSSGAVTVYPNPSDGSFFIHMESLANTDVVLSIFSQDGKLVSRNDIPAEQNNGQFALVNRSLPAGLYLIHVKGNTTSETIKVVIQ